MTANQHITVHPIPALKDNYVWAIIHREQNTAVIVDPGEAQPVLDFLHQQKLTLIAILITHHHWDHTGGIAGIVEQYPVPVYAPATENIPHRTHPVTAHTPITLDRSSIALQVIEIPGHTRGHVAYYGGGMLFCGDTLFGAGCGRLFEGTANEMVASLTKLTTLPDDTRIYCAHEYTQQNLRFALTVEPSNPHITERIEKVKHMRENQLPSLPSTLREEKNTNPFLRCDIETVKQAVERHSGKIASDVIAVFVVLREWKNSFI